MLNIFTLHFSLVRLLIRLIEYLLGGDVAVLNFNGDNGPITVFQCWYKEKLCDRVNKRNILLSY